MMRKCLSDEGEGANMSKITKLAAEELAGLACDRQRLKALKQELSAINAKLYSPRGATLDAVPTHGGGNKQEEKIVNLIDDPRRKSLQEEIKQIEAKITSIHDTVEKLNDTERKVIRAYDIDGTKSMAKLMQETNYSEPHLVRVRLEALRKYAYMRGLDLKA